MEGDSLRILRADIALEQRRIVPRISSIPRPVVCVIMATATPYVVAVQLVRSKGGWMQDAFADSKARLERLVKLAIEETDSAKQDELTTEIRRILDERGGLKKALGIQNPGQTFYLRLEDRKVLKLIERLEKQILQAKSLATGTKAPGTLAS